MNSDQIKLNLETKIFYRLVKVLYIFSLCLSFCCTIYFNSNLIPYDVVDNESSYAICADNKKYYFKNLDIGFIHAEVPLSKYEFRKLQNACRMQAHAPEYTKILSMELTPANTQKIKIEGTGEIVKFPTSMSKDEMKKVLQKEFPKSYPIDWKYITIGSWYNFFKDSLIKILIVFFIIDAVKKSIVYIVYGEKFSYNLLRIILK